MGAPSFPVEVVSDINGTEHTLSTEAVQKWVRQADHDAEALIRGDFSVFPEKGRIAVDHWTALLSCTLEFQKAVLAALPKHE